MDDDVDDDRALSVAADGLTPGTPSPAPILIAIRTHYIDAELLELARSLAAGDRYEVVFAVDERAGLWDTAEFAKLSLTVDAVTRLGLYIQDGSFLWKFGDYIFYLLRQMRPDAPYAWLLENDVLINFADRRAPFQMLDAASDHDLLATHVEKAPPGWFWRPTVEDLYPDVYRCFFPFIRMSARAADHLFQVRRQASQVYGKTERFQFNSIPNDEAFVASDLVAAGFLVADINQVAVLYNRNSFDFSTLFNRRVLSTHDNLLYHSALSGSAYVAKLIRLANSSCSSMLDAVASDAGVGFDAIHGVFFARLGKELLPFADDPARLFAASSIISRTLAQVASPAVLDRIADSLAQGLKPRCLAAFKRRHRAHFGDRPGPFPNIALGRPARQSSTCAWSRHGDVDRDASGANDGRLDVAFGCHTDEEDGPWWRVDLEVPSLVYRVRIQNRRELEIRLGGFRIESSMDGETWQVVHAAPVGRVPELSVTIELSEPALARYLRLIVPGRTILHIVEFEAYGHPVDQRMVSQKKVAIGILAHSAPSVLEQTLQHWPAASFTIFVHVDSKADIELFRFVERFPNAHLIESRVDIFWGGFSMVLAEIKLMRACVERADFDYFLLLSDDSVPLLSAESLIGALQNRSSWKTFQPDHSASIRQRYESFVCYDIWPTSPRQNHPERTISIADFDVLFGLRLLMEKGKAPMPRLFHGSQWTGLTAKSIRHVLEVHDTQPDIQRSFRFSSIPDEMYVHTILGIGHDEHQHIDRFMYADFSRRPGPYILTTMADLEWAIENRYLFARKIRDPAFAASVVQQFPPIGEDDELEVVTLGSPE